MRYSEYKSWMERNKPLGMPMADFQDFVGLIGALTLTQNMQDSDKTIDDLIVQIFPENELN